MILNMQLRNARFVSRQSGFTLIEVLLVIVIILMLAGALVVFVLPQQENAEKNTTKLLLQNIETGLDMYRLNMGRYPTTEQGLDALMAKPTFENEKLGEKWAGPYLKTGTKLEDPWGNKLHYELNDVAAGGDDPATKNAPRYKLFSVGPDGQPDTTDDIKPRPDSTDSTGAGTTKSD